MAALSACAEAVAGRAGDRRHFGPVRAGRRRLAAAGPSGERCAGGFAPPPALGASAGRRGRRPAMESEYYSGDQSGSGAEASPAGGTLGALGPVRGGAGHGGARGDRPALSAWRLLPAPGALRDHRVVA